MDKNSKSSIQKRIQALLDDQIITEPIKEILDSFYETYFDAVIEKEGVQEAFSQFLDLVLLQCQHPYPFEPYHSSVRSPIDYYKFGLDFLRPLVVREKSTILGQERLAEIEAQMQRGENVVFFANHQIEPDPIAISLLLEDHHPKLAHEMIFVAGARVLTDPLAVPFSLGCNLLCIYSKRYIDNPPEKKLEKQLHNKKTMQLMSSLLKEGGKCIYVAPSGGRDRQNSKGVVEIAPFDSQSIEMFYLMAKKSKRKTHFYPMALDTYDLMPPPETIQKELGEMRVTNRVPIHLAIGTEIDMDHFPGSDQEDKHLRRKSRADYIWDCVRQDYQRFSKDLS